jgi:hypothetical protein
MQRLSAIGHGRIESAKDVRHRVDQKDSIGWPFTSVRLWLWHLKSMIGLASERVKRLGLLVIGSAKYEQKYCHSRHASQIRNRER